MCAAVYETQRVPSTRCTTLGKLHACIRGIPFGLCLWADFAQAACAWPSCLRELDVGEEMLMSSYVRLAAMCGGGEACKGLKFGSATHRVIVERSSCINAFARHGWQCLAVCSNYSSWAVAEACSVVS